MHASVCNTVRQRIRDGTAWTARQTRAPGKDAVVRKEADRLIIEPVRPRSSLALLATLEPIDDDFPTVTDPPIDDVDLKLSNEERHRLLRLAFRQGSTDADA